MNNLLVSLENSKPEHEQLVDDVSLLQVPIAFDAFNMLKHIKITKMLQLNQ